MDKHPDGKKYQFHFGSHQFMDEEDRQLSIRTRDYFFARLSKVFGQYETASNFFYQLASNSYGIVSKRKTKNIDEFVPWELDNWYIWIDRQFDDHRVEIIHRYLPKWIFDGVEEKYKELWRNKWESAMNKYL